MSNNNTSYTTFTDSFPSHFFFFLKYNPRVKRKNCLLSLGTNVLNAYNFNVF